MRVSHGSELTTNNAQQIPVPEPLVQVTRGAITESRHRGHVVAVEPDGTIVAHLGVHPRPLPSYDPQLTTPQSRWFIGAADRFGFSEQKSLLHARRTAASRSIRRWRPSMLRKMGLGPAF